MHDEHSAPSGPGQSSAPGEQGAKGIMRSLGTGVGCLLLLVGAAVLVVVALAYFFNEPALSLAAVALVVAVIAYRARRGTS